MNCPNCKFDNRPDAQYCGMCGARLVQTCATCGFANPLTYRFCIHCGQTLDGTAPARAASPRPTRKDRAAEPAEPADTPTTPNLAGERRVATIILADVKGSTDLLEALGTETWVKTMNHVFQVLEAQIYHFGGKVDQFRGDGLVAFFGATTAHEDDPERAVLASLAIQQAIEAYAAELHQTLNIDIQLRIGINTGEVIVASIGDSQRYSEDTAMGEAIALAARMETAAEPGTVLVSDNTYRLVKNQFEWQSLGEIRVKGISFPIAVYRPLAPKSDVEWSEAYRLGTPIIGRDAEFAALKYNIHAVSEGIGGIVLLQGDRGMGKSLLINKARHHFARQGALMSVIASQDMTRQSSSLPESDIDVQTSKIRELRGRSRSYDQSLPYGMWIDLLRNWLGVRRDEPKAEKRKRLHHQLGALWGSSKSEYYPYLAAFLSIPLEDELAAQVHQLDAEGLRQKVFLAVRNWVQALVQQGPLVITFSDVQWADTTSLDLLKYCLPLCDQYPLLWLIALRPERTSPIWKFRYYVETEYPHRITTLKLQPLDEAQSRTFVEQLIGPNVLPAPTEQLIIEKAEGNPYYIQEFIRALIAEGVLERKIEVDPQSESDPPTERWHVTQAITTLTLPDSLQSIVLSRIDRLPIKAQQTLQLAAVIGPVFWSKVLKAVLGDTPLLHKSLTALQRAELIRERGRIPDLGIEYVFNSTLIRDTAYDSLLSGQRTTYHLQVAEALEALLDTKEGDCHYGLMAHHYRQAGEANKELLYTLKAAEHAKKIYANAEAGDHYTHALDLLDRFEARATDDETLTTLRKQRFQVLTGRREVFELMGNTSAMWADAEALLPLARQLPQEPKLLIDAILEQPGVASHVNQTEVEEGLAMIKEALNLARELGDQRREMFCLIALTNHKLAFNDPTWQEFGEQALHLAQKVGDQRTEARLLIGLGRLYGLVDQSERSMEYIEAAAALVLTHALDDKLIQTTLLRSLGLQLERSGDYYRLLTEYQQERLLISQEIGHRPIESSALTACGEICGLYLGNQAEGRTLLEEAFDIQKDAPGSLMILASLAEIQVAQGNHEEALETLHLIEQRRSEIFLNHRAEASLALTSLVIYNASFDKHHLDNVPQIAEHVQQIADTSPLVSQQHAMAAACKASEAHLKLAKSTINPQERRKHQAQALQASQTAIDLYYNLGYVQIVECVSEEILFRHSQALSANAQQDKAVKYLRKAYDEMNRKHALIPHDSNYRRTYLENIPLHKEIRAAYAARVGSILTQPQHLAETPTHATPH